MSRKKNEVLLTRTTVEIKDLLRQIAELNVRLGVVDPFPVVRLFMVNVLTELNRPLIPVSRRLGVFSSSFARQTTFLRSLPTLRTEGLQRRLAPVQEDVRLLLCN